MATKINVTSGDPYRGTGGQFGTSPDQKLADSFKTLQAQKLVKPEDNDKKVAKMAKEAKAKLAALRSQSTPAPDGTTPTDNPNWKAMGTEAEANDFAKGSKFKGTLYHGTTQTSATAISKKGFDMNKKAKRGETNFPGTIMLAADPEEAAWYGRRAGGDDGQVRPYGVLSAKIMTTKHKKFNSDGYDKFRGNMTQEETIKKLFSQYDSFEISGFGVSTVAVKDPKQIMVFKNDKR